MKSMKILAQKLLKSKAGFTLTQLMISMSIIGLTATAGMSQYDEALAAARDARRMADMHQVQLALYFYYDDYGQYPVSNSTEPTIDGWQKMKDELEDMADGSPYMQETPKDKLNQGEYVYKYYSNGKSFRIAYETENSEDKSPVIIAGY